ncbi:MAG: glycosyltransferase family 4 protein [Pirellulales bacterium]
MKPLRVVFVTRRFWPLVGGAHESLGLLAGELARRGADCRVVTIRWQADWPESIEHHGVKVHRLPRPTPGLWGSWRHARRLRAWLSAHCPGAWTICVSGMRHEAAAVLRAAHRRQWRVVLRPAGAGLTGDCHWQLEAAGGRRLKRICLSADAFIAPTRACENELIAAGYPRGRISFAPCGVPQAEPATAAARQAARQVLGQAHPALAVTGDSLIAAYTGRIVEGKGLDYLIDAWRPIVSRWPASRLWLIGEGALTGPLEEQVRRLGMASSIALPGAFDSVDDVLAAADLYVSPAIDTGTGLGLLGAMAAGLPVVASDVPGHQEFVSHGQQGDLCAAGDAAALAQAISRLWEDAAALANMGQAARQRAQAEFNLQAMADRYGQLLTQ